jgi:double-strand break repair protein MRE11
MKMKTTRSICQYSVFTEIMMILLEKVSMSWEGCLCSTPLPPLTLTHASIYRPRNKTGGVLLAALDLLSVSNLVNYFGRQDDVNKVDISPVLIQKGSTKVALYGLGNMRDERLNRMWQGKKVRFLRPEEGGGGNKKGNDDDNDENENEEDDSTNGFFNIFILHQNRDNMGRGSKNCIHESMIPAWMDLAIFGHEHTSEPVPAESVVGTFRITQPGSSVATSLTMGEAERKHAVLLNVRGNKFRLDPIPLTMIRSFVMKDISLSEHTNLDPEDPKVDSKITKILEEELRMWIYNAREKDKTLLDDAEKAGNFAASDDSPLKYKMTKREQVLCRLRVEHTGFTTLNNQRFGARFVGEVGNPSDVLLFVRAKKKTTSSGNKSKRKAADVALEEPIIPIEIAQVSVEDLVKDNLEEADAKLTILSEKALNLALEDYVDKSDGNAIMETTEAALKKSQASLYQNASQVGDDDDDDERYDVVKALKRQSQQGGDEAEARRPSEAPKRKRSNSSGEDSLDKENQSKAPLKKKPSKASPKSSRNDSRSIEIDSSDDEVNVSTESSIRPKLKATTNGKRKSGDGDIRSFVSRNPQSQLKGSSSQKRSKAQLFDDDDEDVEAVSIQKRDAPRRRTAKGRVNYSVDIESDDDFHQSDDSFDEPPKKKAAGRKAPVSNSRGKSPRGRKGKIQDTSMDLDSNWGSASTRK